MLDLILPLDKCLDLFGRYLAAVADPDIGCLEKRAHDAVRVVIGVAGIAQRHVRLGRTVLYAGATRRRVRRCADVTTELESIIGIARLQPTDVDRISLPLRAARCSLRLLIGSLRTRCA